MASLDRDATLDLSVAPDPALAATAPPTLGPRAVHREPAPTAKPTPKPIVRKVQPKRPLVAPASRHPTIVAAGAVAAHATWYCLPPRSRCTIHHDASCLCAAISPDLSYMTGRSVEVCSKFGCVTVRIVDCNCQSYRGIDLYYAAFHLIAPRGAGRVAVTLRLAG